MQDSGEERGPRSVAGRAGLEEEGHAGASRVPWTDPPPQISTAQLSADLSQLEPSQKPQKRQERPWERKQRDPEVYKHLLQSDEAGTITLI